MNTRVLLEFTKIIRPHVSTVAQSVLENSLTPHYDSHLGI